MSERYDVRKLKRDWIRRLAAGAKPIEPRARSIADQAAFERREAIRSLRGAPLADMQCTHGVCWLDCRVCSKSRAR